MGATTSMDKIDAAIKAAKARKEKKQAAGIDTGTVSTDDKPSASSSTCLG